MERGGVGIAQREHGGKHSAHQGHPANADHGDFIGHRVDPPKDFYFSWYPHSYVKREQALKGSFGI